MEGIYPLEKPIVDDVWGGLAKERAPIVLREYETAKDVFLTAEEREILYRRFSGYLQLGRDWETGAYLLSATHYVGVIQIGDLRIRIEPKCPAANFFYMLTYANRLKVDWNEETHLTSIEEILELVVEKFVTQVEQLIRRGLYRTYREEEDQRPYLRGRLNISEQVRRDTIAANGFSQRFHEYTPDVLVNRIIAWTLLVIARLPWRNPLLHRRIRRAEQWVVEVTPMPVHDSDFDRVLYTRLNEGYRKPHALARLLLRLWSIEGTEGRHHFRGWLLDMNQLFEGYVGAYLQEHIARFPGAEGCRVKRQGTLYVDSQGEEAVSPDIQILRGNMAIAVLDTKHKVLEGKPNESDRRQLLEYANHLGLRHGYLLYSGGAPELPYRRYSGGWTLDLHSAVWNLGGNLDELRGGSKRLAESLIAEILLQSSDGNMEMV